MVESADGNYSPLAIIVHFAYIQQGVVLHFELAFHIQMYDFLAESTRNGISNIFDNVGFRVVFLAIIGRGHNLLCKFVHMLFLFGTGKKHYSG